jgi:hypothetical protein
MRYPHWPSASGFSQASAPWAPVHDSNVKPDSSSAIFVSASIPTTEPNASKTSVCLVRISKYSKSTLQNVSTSEYPARLVTEGSYTQRLPAKFGTLISSVSTVFGVIATVTRPSETAWLYSPKTGRPQPSPRVTRVVRPRMKVPRVAVRGMAYSPLLSGA